MSRKISKIDRVWKFIPANENMGQCSIYIPGIGELPVKMESGRDPYRAASRPGHKSYIRKEGKNFILMNPALPVSGPIVLGPVEGDGEEISRFMLDEGEILIRAGQVLSFTALPDGRIVLEVKNLGD